MKKAKSILCIALIMIITVCSCYITAFAEAKTANIVGNNVAIRNKPSTKDSTVLLRVSNVSVTVNSETKGDSVTADGKTSDVWYNITYGDTTGYVTGIYISFPPNKDDYEYDEDFEKNLLNFPESYRDSLRALHAKYPNWQFKAHNIDLTFKEAVEAQYGVSDIESTRKWVEFTYGGNEWRDMRAYDKANDKWITLEGRWTYASRAAIEYFMDPRNSLDENNIFAFMQQSYDSKTHTVDGLKTVVEGTFLAKGYDPDGDGPEPVNANAYLDDIMAAAAESGVNPYVLAATIIVEQGAKGESSLISGNYKGYEGYYNFFNFAAAGDDIVGNGLKYAKEHEWNSRRASIIGGAKSYADGYISVGQDTYYYKDFNVVNKIWWHQYASALYDAWTNAKRLQKGCVTNTNATLVFTIPVYKDMPQEPCAVPTVSVEPETPTTPTTPSTPTPPPEKVIPKGDTNQDGAINAIDLATVKMHILSVKTVSGDAAKAADVNGDGAINAIDLAAVKMHILGVKKITN